MPYITAKENAGLSPQPNASDIDSYVKQGAQIGIDWIESFNNNVAKIKLAGPYTYPGSSIQLPAGTERYLNPNRFQVPSDAWVQESPIEPLPQSTQVFGEYRLPPETTQLTHYYEGFRHDAYEDPVSLNGLPITIGWGNTYYENRKKVRLGERISRDRGDELYENIMINDFMSVQQKVIPYWSEMTSKQRAALLSFSYNCGARYYGAQGFETITAKLKDKLWDQVPYALMLYRAGAQVGLGRRRYAEGLVWCGMEPYQACQEAERSIQTSSDAEIMEQRLRNNFPKVEGWSSTAGQTTKNDHSPPTESVREEYNPNKPVDWNNPQCKVSKYFTVREVTQNDPRRKPRPGSVEEQNCLKLAKELDKVREAWGGPIGVTSWYRPEPINSQVGGVRNSQHITGKAADIYTLDSSRAQEFEHWLETVAWKDKALGLGVKSGRGFTHCDLRPSPIRWNY